jgi:hypothetical protein
MIMNGIKLGPDFVAHVSTCNDVARLEKYLVSFDETLMDYWDFVNAWEDMSDVDDDMPDEVMEVCEAIELIRSMEDVVCARLELLGAAVH